MEDIFVRNRQSGAIERVSVSLNGEEGDGRCLVPSISADGRYASFYSAATNLVGGDVNGSWDAFVRDRQNHTTELVSVDSEPPYLAGVVVNDSETART
jgi:hypothetical protein